MQVIRGRVTLIGIVLVSHLEQLWKVESDRSNRKGIRCLTVGQRNKRFIISSISYWYALPSPGSRHDVKILGRRRILPFRFPHCF